MIGASRHLPMTTTTTIHPLLTRLGPHQLSVSYRSRPIKAFVLEHWRKGETGQYGWHVVTTFFLSNSSRPELTIFLTNVPPDTVYHARIAAVFMDDSTSAYVYYNSE